MKEAFLEPILRRFRISRVIAHIPKSSVILDIGCGRKAAFLQAVSPYIKEGFGVDFKVDENVQIPNVRTLQLRLESNLPFADCSFDVVTMLAVLEHIEKEEQILSEIHRVLVPGGKLIITVPSVWAQPVLEFLAYKLKIVSEAEIRDHKRYYTREKLQKILVRTIGFTEFKHRYFQLWMNNFCTVTKSK
ncbi:methyltransferase domain-containing protein [Aerosakkonemataceae cyanobacterium BLCC-F154]|uniref:Methyltransferase domain-containing protein n=1 Tax=Floridaenema fluviatile BLCC-F154 TaxID=3153640 RepID=A0ABV4Y9H9_9CYAN